MLDIKVLGTGCPKCLKLGNLCTEVVNDNNLEATIEKVTDIDRIIGYGIYMTPGLIVNGKVLVQGKIPARATLEHWLKEF
jgi:small redox-active disulfide protein 2